MHGDDRDFISMEGLASCYAEVSKAIKKYSKYLPNIPSIPANLGQEVKAQLLIFPNTIDVKSFNGKSYFEMSKISDVIYLQTGKSYVAAFEITELTDNYVFSIALTTDPYDLAGRNKETVLFRNGVTASYATKLRNKIIQWGYHGKPLKNLGRRMFIKATVTNREFTLSYDDITTNNQWIIHGDYPIALLDKKYVGEISSLPFYLVLYFKRKSGHNNIKIYNIYPEYGIVQKM